MLGQILRSKVVFDYEAKPLHPIAVRAYSSGGYSHDKIIEINILDVTHVIELFLTNNRTDENDKDELWSYRVIEL